MSFRSWRKSFRKKGQDNMNKTVQNLLYAMGVNELYFGFEQTGVAVELLLSDPELVHNVTQWLYPDVGLQCNTSGTNVEKNIRTVINKIWNENRDQMEQLAGRGLVRKPTARQFILLLAHQLKEQDLSPQTVQQ